MKFMDIIKYYSYWYCFIARGIKKNTESDFWVGFKAAGVLALAEAAWGTAGIIFMGVILEYKGSLAHIYFKIFILSYIIISIFSVKYIILGDMEYYDRQIDKMSAAKRKKLWWLYAFLSNAPVVLCLIMGFYKYILQAKILK